MRTIIAAAAAITALLPAVAFADEAERRFTRDGETYVYKQVVREDGTKVLQGRRIGGGKFRLVVAGTRISGQANGHPVSFRVAPANTATTELAAN